MSFLPLSKSILTTATQTFEKLTNLGWHAEGGYLVRETIQAATTESEVGMLRSMLGSVGAMPTVPSAWDEPEISERLSNLTGDLIRSHHGPAAVHVLTVGLRFRPPANAVTSDSPRAPQFPIGELTIDLRDRLTDTGRILLDRGRPEGVSLFGALGKLTPITEDVLGDLQTSIDRLPKRKRRDLPDEVLTGLGVVAKGFAFSGRYPTAVRMGMLIDAVSSSRSSDPHGKVWLPSATDPELQPGQVWLPSPGHVSEAVTRNTGIMIHASSLISDLLDRGYPAEAATLLDAVLGLPDSSPDSWRPLWDRLDSRVVAQFPTFSGTLRQRAKGYVFRAFGPMWSPPPHVSLEAVIETVAGSEPFIVPVALRVAVGPLEPASESELDTEHSTSPSDSAAQSVHTAFLDARFDGDAVQSLYTNVSRELLLSVVSCQQTGSLLPGDDAMVTIDAPLDESAEFYFLVSSPDCTITPIEPAFCVASGTPARFGVIPRATTTVITTRITITVLRHLALLHVASFDIDILPAPLMEDASL